MGGSESDRAARPPCRPSEAAGGPGSGRPPQSAASGPQGPGNSKGGGRHRELSQGLAPGRAPPSRAQSGRRPRRPPRGPRPPGGTPCPWRRRRAAPSLWSLLGRLRHLRWPCGAMCMSTVRRNLTGSALPVRCHHQSFLAASPPRRGGSEPTAPPPIDCRRRLPMAQALPALPGCSGGGGGGLIGARVRLRLDRPLRLGPLTPLVAWVLGKGTERPPSVRGAPAGSRRC